MTERAGHMIDAVMQYASGNTSSDEYILREFLETTIDLAELVMYMAMFDYALGKISGGTTGGTEGEEDVGSEGEAGGNGGGEGGNGGTGNGSGGTSDGGSGGTGNGTGGAGGSGGIGSGEGTGTGGSPEGSGGGKYSEEEINSILKNVRGDGYKNNPLRQAYENEVASLKTYGEELLASGMSEEQVARTLNQKRRDLGIEYKNMTPQPLRDFIYELNMGRYEDELGPTYDRLKNVDGRSDREIINSASQPNSDIDKLLSGFEEWLRRQ